jgi:hypothetical protein
MKFTSAVVAAATAAVVAATPAGITGAEKIKPNEVFQLMSLRTGTPLQFGSIQASKNGFQVNNKAQNASCGPEPSNFAQFQLTEQGDLYLYTANPPQQAFVDRSGMGQGIFHYTTGVESLVRNGERGPFTLDENNYLTFGKTTGFQACLREDTGDYAIWLSGVTNPAGYKECTPFTAQALKVEAPVKCMYTN